MATDNQSRPTIKTEGLGQVGVQLELPYEGRSAEYVLLLNKSDFHIIACNIRFEFVTEKGEIRPAQKVLAYHDLLKESDLHKRKDLLKLQPAIAPHTKWLIGMGVDPDLVLIGGKLAPLPMRSAVNDDLRESYQELIIKLDAVVFENGEAVGPGAKEFLQHLRTDVLNEK